LQNDGLVLAPQAAVGFTGPSANLLVHAWYNNTLGDTWRKLLRAYPTAETKAKTGIEVMHLITVNSLLMRQSLPLSVLVNDRSNLLNTLPIHRRVMAAYRVVTELEQIYQKAKVHMPMRWDDVKEENEGAKSVPIGLAGRLEEPTPRSML
jgi:hypothetical protein